MKEKHISEKSILKVVFDRMEELVIVYDLKDKIVDCNNAARTIFGLNSKTECKQSLYDLIPEDCHPEQKQALISLHKNSSPQALSLWLSTTFGVIPVSISATTIYNEIGKEVGYIHIIKNITAARTAEEKQNILSAIIEGSQDAIISKTLNGTITSWNKAASKIFGYKEKEVIGKHISIIIPDDRLDEETKILENIKIGIKTHHFHTVRQKKSGQLVDISLTVSPVKDLNGIIIGASKIARDISHEKKAEAATKQLSKKKDEFIALASHELKIPLTTMSGYLQLLHSRATAANKAFVDRALKQLKRLTALINDLFDISQIQYSNLKLSFEPFNISQLATELIEQFIYLNPAREFESDIENNIILEGNKTRLEQVISNLISNAIKYSTDISPINISLRQNGADLYFSIQDEGIGIDKKTIKHIFSQYFRAESIEKSIPGLGLGLYISKAIIVKHHGKIKVDSKVGEGSTFTFKIPISQKNRNKVNT